MALIVFLSSSRFSFSTTVDVISPAIRLWHGPEGAQLAPSVALVIRKAAHVSLYAILTLLISAALAAKPGGRKTSARLQTGFTVLAIMLCAAFDEWRQSYALGRIGQISDVLFDLAGCVIGLAVFRMWRRLRASRP